MTDVDEKLYKLGTIVQKQTRAVEELTEHVFGISYATYAIIDHISKRSEEEKSLLRNELVSRFESLDDQKSETARYLAVFIKHLS